MARTLVGREEERTLVRRMLAAGGSVVLGGHAGVGKTSLARDVAGWWVEGGRPVEWSVATPAGSGVPFGAVARILAPVADASSGVLADRAAEIVRRSVQAAVAQPGLLVVVDDGHHLDAFSALLVQHLALAGHPVLVTVRNGEVAQPALESLWVDEHAARLDLVALSEAEAREVAESLVDGPIDDESARLLFEASQGNPLLLRELARDAFEAGTLRFRADRWGWDGSVGRGRRLRDVFARRLADAGPTARRVVLLVALGQPLRLGLLEPLVGSVAVADAEHRGLVVVDAQGGGHPTVGLDHPLLGEVVLSTVEPDELDQLRTPAPVGLHAGTHPILPRAGGSVAGRARRPSRAGAPHQLDRERPGVGRFHDRSGGLRGGGAPDGPGHGRGATARSGLGGERPGPHPAGRWPDR